MKKLIFIALCTLILTFVMVSRLQNSYAADLSSDRLGNSRYMDEISYDTAYNVPAQQLFDVLHYNIRIDVRHQDKIIVADVAVKGIVKANTNELVFNLYENMVIDSLVLNNAEITYRRDETHIYLRNLTLQAGDTVVVRALYSGTPVRRGFASFVFGRIHDIPLIHTLNEPQYAGTWLFCDDSPADKATMDMYLITDSTLTAVSNGSLQSEKFVADKKETHWKSDYQIATYLICFYVSQYVQFQDTYVSASGKQMPINYYVLPKHADNAKKDFRHHPKVIQTFAELFGEYPFINEKYGVAEFLWQGGAMEHQTITGVGTGLINGNNYFDDIYVHEVAHQWWGNAVTIKDWKDIWLNEGFASYSEVLFAERVKGPEDVQRKLAEFANFRQGGTLHNPDSDLFSSMVYHKGAYVLHMLRHEIGDSVFFRMLKEYYRTYCYQQISSEEFIQLCEKLSGKSLTKFFDQWLYTGTTNPKIDFTWVVEGNELVLQLHQTQEGYSPFAFSLDVMLEYSDNVVLHNVAITQKDMTFRFPVSGRPNAVVLDPQRKLLLDVFDRNPYE